MFKRLLIALALLLAAPALVVAQQQPQNAMTVTVKGVSFRMIRVQGGTFTMGATAEQGSDADDDEKPAHKVTLSTYYIGETEVTQELWQAVMGSNPSRYKPKETNAAQCSYDAFVADAKRLNAKKPGTMRVPTRQEWYAAMVTTSGTLKRPVEDVCWDDCQKFIRRLNQLTGKKFRLPTEAEWEFAARGGTKSRGYKYSGGNDIGTVAWYTVNAEDKGESSSDYGTHVVKTKQPNELGIYDMAGNVWELCQDCYGNYSDGAQTSPQGPSTGSCRVGRGGSWNYSASQCRTSNRFCFIPHHSFNFVGLRLVLVP
ncbi:MAG: formylglycine-generating enzyme family protein [Bacteroidales bacterium]|nr:formylglycine-generating enzyme family protein [Bacteroidales bacterium]